MNEFAIVNVTTTQRRGNYANIPMNVYSIMNVLMVQRRIFYANVTMDVFGIVNVVMTQRRENYANIPMNTSITTNILISQLGTSCSFDSPGLARNEPTSGKRSQGDSTPSVLSFFYEGMVIARAFMADCA